MATDRILLELLHGNSSTVKCTLIRLVDDEFKSSANKRNVDLDILIVKAQTELVSLLIFRIYPNRLLISESDECVIKFGEL